MIYDTSWISYLTVWNVKSDQSWPIFDLSRRDQENKDRVEASLRQSQSIERQFTAQKTTVTDLSQRILTSEASSNDGILIWKLNTFHQRRQDAISGRVTSFYSPCFFTSRTGQFTIIRASKS